MEQFKHLLLSDERFEEIWKEVNNADDKEEVLSKLSDEELFAFAKGFIVWNGDTAGLNDLLIGLIVRDFKYHELDELTTDLVGNILELNNKIEELL